MNKQVINICLFVDSFLPKIGGMELAIHHLANELTLQGCNVTIVAKYNKGECLLEKRYVLKRYGNKFPGSGRIGADTLSGIAAFIAAHHKNQFDIVNCHSVSYAGSKIFLALKMGIVNLPVIMTPHGEDIQMVQELDYGLRLKKKWDRIIKRNLKAADNVTAISDTVRKHLSFLSTNKIHKIPNGIHLSNFVKKDNKYLHRKLSISHRDKIVLSVGRHRAVKGYEYGIRAFVYLLRHSVAQSVRYVIIGRNTQELEPLIGALNLESRVLLMPQMDHQEVIAAYQSAWCFLSPSLSEGLSLVSIEAMACGLPLVVTDVPGNSDIIRDNSCGLTVRPKDPESISRGLLSMLSNPDAYQRFAEKALVGAKHYDWPTIAKQYIDVYRQTINRRGSSRV